MFSRGFERHPRKAADMPVHGKSIARLWVIAALISPLFGNFQNAVKPAIIHGPYLQNPTENSVTVIWFTNKDCTSWVEYGTGESLGTFPKFGSLVSVAKSGRHGLIEANTARHEVRLGGLVPGKTYRYRVASKEILQFAPYEVIYGVDHLTKLWGPILNEGGIDLAICGHYHRLFKFAPEPGKNAFPVIGAPQDALIRADVTAASIDLKIIDIKGTTLESLKVSSKKK
jgi:hypothetical protein